MVLLSNAILGVNRFHRNKQNVYSFSSNSTICGRDATKDKGKGFRIKYNQFVTCDYVFTTRGLTKLIYYLLSSIPYLFMVSFTIIVRSNNVVVLQERCTQFNNQNNDAG